MGGFGLAWLGLVSIGKSALFELLEFGAGRISSIECRERK
jgi:hypothetical protein